MTGVVLAGGCGSRMGGRDKGLVHFRGQPLVAHVIERLRPQVARLAISANRHRDVYARWGWPVWPDPEPRGPLAGMTTALSRIETEFAAFAPCDAPLLPEDLVPRLAAEMAGREMAVAHADGRIQPVFALLPRRLVPELAAFVAAGGERVMDWVAGREAAIVEFPDGAAFSNVNTLDDLQWLDENGPET